MQQKIFISLLLLSVLTQSFASNCWKDSYGRGAGKPISSCHDGYENDASLCYPYCRSGYKGVGPVCWQNCPSGFPDTGADCLKPSSYGRGAGYTSKSQCVSHFPSQGCEEWGLLWYPKCRANFHNVACCVCSPNCQNGMIDIGVSCQKDSYGRGVGTPLVCKSDEEYENGLCYTPCKNGYDANGPVCWGQCPKGKYDCSALCVDSADGCTDEVKNIAVDVVALAVVIAESAIGVVDIIAIIKDLGKVAIDLADGVCQAPSAVEYFKMM